MSSSLNGTGITFSDSSTQSVGTSGNFKFNSGYGSEGVAYGCRIWVRYAANGATGANASIFGSGGVSSVTKTGTATFTMNFSITLPDGNYSVAGVTQKSNTNANAIVGLRSDSVFATTSLSGIVAGVPGTGTDNVAPSMSVQIFR